VRTTAIESGLSKNKGVQIMSEMTLEQLIRAEFDARAQRVKQSEEARDKAAQIHNQRMANFNRVCEDLHSIVQPRIEEFARAMGQQVKITPTITPAERSATVTFLTDLANVTLTVKMAPDPEVTKLVLEYDLLILPMFFDYDRYARLEMPLDKIDRGAVAKWLDDRIMSCVRSYLAIQDNEHYLRRANRTTSPTPAPAAKSRT
jgi:hypothetical protein